MVNRRKPLAPCEVGRLGAVSPDSLVKAARLIREGMIYDLGTERFNGMPQASVHPPFQVMSYRTPQGLRNNGDVPLVTDAANSVGFGFLSEMLMSGMHVGTHVDALSHVVAGTDQTWYGGHGLSSGSLGDFGPLCADGASLLPIFSRGVLLDVARVLHMEALPCGYGITVQDLYSTLREMGITIETDDVVLVRTGHMREWPDRARMQQSDGAGLTLQAAQWLVDQGAAVVGADTETVEQIPSRVVGHPHPVHDALLRQQGIHLLEMLDLEALAKDERTVFAFVGLPLKVRGATGSMMDPIAVI